MKYNNIMFDLDGTLTDPKEGITKSVQYALEHFDIFSDTNDLIKFIGPPLRESFMNYYGFDAEQSEKAVEKYREYFTVKGLYENSVYEGIHNMLRELRAMNACLFVATSKPTVYAAEILKHFNLFEYFNGLYGSELDGSRSKKFEIISLAMQENELKHENAIMVGDREHDVAGAAAAGIKSIGVLFGYGGYDELKRAGADYIVNDVNELRLLLTELVI